MEFDTYHGASAIDRSILDWHLCRMTILELLTQPHSSMPYVHMGFIATLYTTTLFSRDNGEFLPKSQYSYLEFRSVFFSFLLCVLSNSVSYHTFIAYALFIIQKTNVRVILSLNGQDLYRNT